MKNHKITFVCGLHKSGTSLFFKSLKNHPDLSGFHDTGVPEDEGQHLQSVYPTAKEHGGMGKFGFDPKAHLTEDSPLVTEENRKKLWEEWKKYWNLDKTILIEKSPPNLIRTRFLQAMFPDAYFLILMRHPIATSYATHKRRLHETVLESRIKHWLKCHEIFFEEDKKHLKRVLEVKYEDFVHNTDSVLEKIYGFLDTEYAPNTMEIRTNVNEKYFAKWINFRQKPVLKAYANRLISQYEDEVNKYGYSLEDLEKF